MLAKQSASRTSNETFFTFINQVRSSKHYFVNVYLSRLPIRTLSWELEWVNILSLGSCRYAITFIFFKLNNYPVCDLKLILDTNIFITATSSCTICVLPLNLYENVRGRERHKTHRPERLGSVTNFIQLFLNYFSESKNMLSSTDNFI